MQHLHLLIMLKHGFVVKVMVVQPHHYYMGILYLSPRDTVVSLIKPPTEFPLVYHLSSLCTIVSLFGPFCCLFSLLACFSCLLSPSQLLERFKDTEGIKGFGPKWPPPHIPVLLFFSVF